MKTTTILILSFVCLSTYGQQQATQASFKGFDMESGPCLTTEQRAALHQQMQQLKQQGKLPAVTTTTSPLFEWPLKAAVKLTDYSYYGISGYVDHDPNFPNLLSNHNCGNITYDTPSGYNHQGTDYFLWPFPWNKVDSDLVEVVAAAPGTIIQKTDGEFDRSCAMNNNPWNYVSIQHSDGSYAWYGHMKKNSVTTKSIGQTVLTGEYLGIVASSGNSTGPHLHFEVYDSGSNLIDPYAGPCNNMNVSSWWNVQHPEIDPALNRLRTNFRAPNFNTCPSPETQNETDYFMPSDSVFFVSYYRALSTGDTANITVTDANNSVAYQWQFISPWSFYNAAYIYYWVILPGNAPTGQWKFEIDYKGNMHEHIFYVGIVEGNDELQAANERIVLSPNPTTGKFSVAGATSEIQVYDLFGRQVLSTRETEIDMNGFTKGLYFIKSEAAVSKLLIQ